MTTRIHYETVLAAVESLCIQAHIDKAGSNPVESTDFHTD